MSPSTRTPYKWDEISETAKHREILTLVNNAAPETRYYYALGRYNTNVNEENWVARWYLWHSFRYRLVRMYADGVLILSPSTRDNRDTRSRTATETDKGGYAGTLSSLVAVMVRARIGN
jgi:hypothetical protein